MRLLFNIGVPDGDIDGKVKERPSARSIIIKDGKVALIYSRKYSYWKFPGGGTEAGENIRDALIRETREEAGLEVIPESIAEYGYVRRTEKWDGEDFDFFTQDNFYFLCDVLEKVTSQFLDDYEAEEGFTLIFADPREAIEENRTKEHGPKSNIMIEREARVLEILIAEKILQ